MVGDSSETGRNWMLHDPVIHIGGVGVGLAPILTMRKKKEIDIPQTTQNSDVAVSMMLRTPSSRI
jgi:hypothetical protein